MKEGDKVKWQDLVSGRTHYGVFIEKQKVVARSQVLKDEYDEPKFKDVDEWDYLIKEDKTGHQLKL